MKTPTLRRFFGLVALLIPACFVVWHALGSVIAAPVVWLAGEILIAWLPALVSEVTLDGTAMFVTSAVGELNGEIVSAEDAGGPLAFRLDTRILTYSIPFYAALHFATPMPGTIERFARGLLILWLLVVVGLVFTALKDLMLTLGPSFHDLGAVPPTAAIALLYQFSVLMVPPVAPVLLWAFEARTTGLFPQLLVQAQPAEADRAQPESPEG